MSKQNKDRARRKKRLLVPVMVMGTLSAGVVGVAATPAHATVAQTYACAYRTNVKLFSGSYTTQGCPPQTDSGASANSLSPAATLPSTGGSISAADEDGAKAVYHGVATFFSSPYDPNDALWNSGRLSVWVAGDPSAVQAVARADTVGPSPFWTRSPSSAEPWAEPAKSGSSYDGTTGYVEATCQAAGSTEVGTVTVKNGFVDTITGSDGYPTETVEVPNPTPINYRVDYTMNNVGDSGYIVFNEQIPNGDGTLTVTGAHMYMQGANAWGDMVIAQTVCGIS